MSIMSFHCQVFTAFNPERPDYWALSKIWYASAKTFACLNVRKFLTRKRAVFVNVKVYIQSVVSKFIFLANVTYNDSTLFEDHFVLPSKDISI